MTARRGAFLFQLSVISIQLTAENCWSGSSFRALRR